MIKQTKASVRFYPGKVPFFIFTHIISKAKWSKEIKEF